MPADFEDYEEKERKEKLKMLREAIKVTINKNRFRQRYKAHRKAEQKFSLMKALAL